MGVPSSKLKPGRVAELLMNRELGMCSKVDIHHSIISTKKKKNARKCLEDDFI